jgi:hypothetical protein
MARYINVEGHKYRVVESLGHNPDIGRRASLVQVGTEERMAVYVGPGEWLFWTSRDRTQPLVSELERRAREASRSDF